MGAIFGMVKEIGSATASFTFPRNWSIVSLGENTFDKHSATNRPCHFLGHFKNDLRGK